MQHYALENTLDLLPSGAPLFLVSWVREERSDTRSAEQTCDCVTDATPALPGSPRDRTYLGSLTFSAFPSPVISVLGGFTLFFFSLKIGGGGAGNKGPWEEEKNKPREYGSAISEKQFKKNQPDTCDPIPGHCLRSPSRAGLCQPSQTAAWSCQCLWSKNVTGTIRQRVCTGVKQLLFMRPPLIFK